MSNHLILILLWSISIPLALRKISLFILNKCIYISYLAMSKSSKSSFHHVILNGCYGGQCIEFRSRLSSEPSSTSITHLMRFIQSNHHPWKSYPIHPIPYPRVKTGGLDCKLVMKAYVIMLANFYEKISCVFRDVQKRYFGYKK